MERKSLWKRGDKSLWREIKIPSNNEFLEQYHQWVFKKVADRFRRDKDRIQDTVQNARVRLLQKDFIGRWFFRHLAHELVSRDEAERILGRDSKLKFISVVQPCVGKRSDRDSLWRVSDLLAYARFDHDRYYYSVQDHTITSDMVLRLLGYLELAVPVTSPEATNPDSKVVDPNNPEQRISFKAEAYNVLKSLYKQGRIKPAELTQHDCCEQIEKGSALRGADGEFVRNAHGELLCSVPGCGKKHFARGFCTSHYGQHVQSKCPICEKGRAALHARGVSLADDWLKNPQAAAALRWNDSQLRPFLRQWRGCNLVSAVPRYIVRPADQVGPYQGIEAGLLKYAWIVINNEVFNDFKRIGRTTDSDKMIFNDGVSPDTCDQDTIAWETEEGSDRPTMVVKDSSALGSFRAAEAGFDVRLMAARANLTDEERAIIVAIDLEETGVREFAEQHGTSVAHIHQVRNAALEKMRNADIADAFISKMADLICTKYDCSYGELIGDDRVGPCVRARAEFFHHLNKFGLSVEEISERTGVPKERVSLAIGRATMREQFLSR